MQMEKRGKKVRKENPYIAMVLDYECNYRAEHENNDGIEPVVAELLLAIYLRLGNIFIMLSAFLGAFFAFILCK